LGTRHDHLAGDLWLLRAHLRDAVPFTVAGSELSTERLRQRFRGP
jgi:hypothetical protein